NFDPSAGYPISAATGPEGIYVATELQLIHLTLDGTPTIEADFTPMFNGEYVTLASTLVMPDAVYGVSYSDGDNNCGFIYRCVPGQGPTILHSFTQAYIGRRRVV